MTIRKNAYLKKEYLYDFGVDGGATGKLTLKATDPNGNGLPEGFVVSKAVAIVETALSPTGGTVTFGPSASVAGYLSDIVAGYNAQNSIVRSGEVAAALLWDDTNDHEIDYRVGSAANTQDVTMSIGTSALTAGKIRFILEGYQQSEGAGY